MLKKLLIAMVAILGMTATLAAKDTYSHDDSVLPQAAKSVLASNFKASVTLVKTDKDFGRVSEYEVILADGTEVKFDKSGNWKSVETAKSKSVPSAMVPAKISEYTAKNQKGARIIGIEKERKGYEVELSNGIDMKFDTQGNFVKFD